MRLLWIPVVLLVGCGSSSGGTTTTGGASTSGGTSTGGTSGSALPASAWGGDYTVISGGIYTEADFFDGGPSGDEVVDVDGGSVLLWHIAEGTGIQDCDLYGTPSNNVIDLSTAMGECRLTFFSGSTATLSVTGNTYKIQIVGNGIDTDASTSFTTNYTMGY